MKQKNGEMGTRDPLLVANYLIDKARKKGYRLTPLQLIKMVYIAHGWFWAFYNKPLLREHVQAWKYGPVIPSLYHAVKGYGREYVTELFHGTEDVDTLCDEEKDLLGQVVDIYHQYSGPRLSALTHQKDTPWEKTWDGSHFQDIPDSLIREYYVEKKKTLEARDSRAS